MDEKKRREIQERDKYNGKRIGVNIKIARAFKEMKAETLAGLLGISPAAVSRMETGNRHPRITMLIRVAEAVDVTIEKLLEGTE